MTPVEDLRADSSWRARAVCGSYPPDWWLTDSPACEKTLALRICAECPVPVQCLAEAIEFGDHGVIRAGRRLSTRPMTERPCRWCGELFTADARVRHCSQTCRRAANRTITAAWRAAQRAKAAA